MIHVRGGLDLGVLGGCRREKPGRSSPD